MDPGDAVLFYTDGMTEACDAEGTFFGEERLRRSIQAALGGAGSQRPSAREVQEALLSDVQAFTGDASPFDDIALAVLMRE